MDWMSIVINSGIIGFMIVVAQIISNRRTVAAAADVSIATTASRLAGDMRADLEALKKEMRNMEKEYFSLQRKFIDVESDLSNYKKKIAELEAELKEYKELVIKLQAELALYRKSAKAGIVPSPTPDETKP